MAFWSFTGSLGFKNCHLVMCLLEPQMEPQTDISLGFRVLTTCLCLPASYRIPERQLQAQRVPRQDLQPQNHCTNQKEPQPSNLGPICWPKKSFWHSRPWTTLCYPWHVWHAGWSYRHHRMTAQWLHPHYGHWGWMLTHSIRKGSQTRQRTVMALNLFLFLVLAFTETLEEE